MLSNALLIPSLNLLLYSSLLLDTTVAALFGICMILVPAFLEPYGEFGFEALISAPDALPHSMLRS